VSESSTPNGSWRGSDIETATAHNGDLGIGDVTIESGSGSATGIAGESGSRAGSARNDGNSEIRGVSLSGSVSLFCESGQTPNVSIQDASVFVFKPGERLFGPSPVLSGGQCPLRSFRWFFTGFRRPALWNRRLSSFRRRQLAISGFRMTVPGGFAPQESSVLS
jgi:hypothetical protein